jgi:transcriptional regulator with XRE-family HTH domain
VVKFLRDRGFAPRNIRHALVELTGITQSEAARRAAISRPVLTNTLNGERSKRDNMARICAVYGVPLPVFFPEARCEACEACNG